MDSKPIVLPVKLGDSVSSLRRHLGKPDEDARDESLSYALGSRGILQPKNWRSLLYLRFAPVNSSVIEAATVNLRFQYRRDTGAVWGIRVMDTWKLFPTEIHGIRNHGILASWLKELGKPNRISQASDILDDYWWVRRDEGVQIRVYSRDCRDVGVTYQRGEAQWVHVIDLLSAPPGWRDLYKPSQGSNLN